jgi:hypothetical protein
MFTAARMVAGLALAAFAFIASEQFKLLMPPDTGFGPFSLINSAVGFFTGWFVMGPRAGHGFGAGLGNGLTGIAALLFWTMFVHGVWEMWLEANKGRFDSVIEAVTSVFEFIVEHGLLVLDGGYLILLGIGAVIVGTLVELTARNWR